MKQFTLSAGTYYIGDLVYFLPDSVFSNLCQQFKTSPNCQLISPNGIIEGLNFWTANGDGTFKLSSGQEIIVDSASIGICKINNGSVRLTSGFSMVAIDKPLNCWEHDGVIWFGDNLNLDTNCDINGDQ